MFKRKRTVRQSLQAFRAFTGIEGFKAGSEQVFDVLYRRFHGPILKYVRTRVGDLETARDITQEVFIKVYRFRTSFEEGRSFSSWLWTIARNTVFDHLRATRDCRSEEADGVSLDELPSPDRSAEALLVGKDQRRKILKSLGSLTRMQKRVLWMRVVHQLSYQEIARKLGISLAAVKNLAYRAKICIDQIQPAFA